MRDEARSRILLQMRALCSMTSGFVSRVEFRQLHSRVLFFGLPKTAHGALVPAVAKAGFYYLFNFDTGYNIVHDPFREPADTHGAFKVQAGAVTYVGDWCFTLQGVTSAIRLDTIIKARNDNPWLERYPLFVSMVGHDVVRLPWEQVPQA